jgi:hypothetical protein
VSRPHALVITTPTAAAGWDNGATLRAAEIVELLTETGHHVVRTTPERIEHVPGHFDVGVAVSFACAGAVRSLRRRARRVWLDAVDSWVLVDGSGVLRRRPAYLLRAMRDAGRLAVMAEPDLVTYISRSDLCSDRGTVRATRRLVLPGRTAPVFGGPGPAGRRAVLAGDWGYPPNRDGLHWFTSRVLPLVERRCSAADWHVAVYGRLPSAVNHHGRLRLLGYADDPRALYRDGDVHVAPIRFGGGVKRKVLQPLVSGLPVVTTPAGANGMRPHPLLDVCRDSETLAAALASRLELPVGRAQVDLREVVDGDDSAAVADWLRS